MAVWYLWLCSSYIGNQRTYCLRRQMNMPGDRSIVPPAAHYVHRLSKSNLSSVVFMVRVHTYSRGIAVMTDAQIMVDLFDRHTSHRGRTALDRADAGKQRHCGMTTCAGDKRSDLDLPRPNHRHMDGRHQYAASA